MNNKKRIIFFLIFTLINFCFYADIIDQVAIVRPNLSQEAGETYLSVASWLDNSRNEDLASMFRAKSEDGGFGSGFLVALESGDIYLVTNFHVIEQADTAEVEFQDHNGAQRIISNCPVIAADENLDLAILSIDQDQIDMTLTGLEINTEIQMEGVDVWTAGYPGFGADPFW